MKLNNKDRRKLRSMVEEKISDIKDNSEKIKFDSELLEQLIFDEMTVSLSDKPSVFKYPVWTGKILQKLDLSELSFDNVFWGADSIVESIINGSEFFKGKLDEDGIIKGENDFLIDFSNTNADIDFTKSFDYKNPNKVAGKQLKLYYANFESVDLSNSNMDKFDAISLQKVNLKNTKAKLNLNKLTEIYSSNLESTDLSTIVLETGFISDENMGDSIYKNSGLKLKGEMTEKISKMIKNHSLDGCFINGVEILSEENKKVQEEKIKQVIRDYEEYKSQLESQIDETIKRVQ